MDFQKDYLHWDRFLVEFPHAHILQCSAWGRIKEEFGWDVYHLVSSLWGTQILVRNLFPGIRFAYIPKGVVAERQHLDRWIANQGSDEFNRSVVDQLSAFCENKRIAFVKIEPDVLLDTLNGNNFCPMGFVSSVHAIQPLRTILIDINCDDAEILARMKQKTRYNIRLAERKGVIVEESCDLDLFYQMMLATGKRDRFGIHSKEYFSKVFRNFYELSQCALFIAFFHDAPIAGLMVFSQGERAFYFYGASTDQHREVMAPYLLQWRAIQWAKAKGCKVYDMWGVPDYDETTLESQFEIRKGGLWGVYRFKRGFGGQVVRYAGAYDLVISPLLYTLYRLFIKGSRNSQ
ncbi:MAG: peptidoglycan bridge formation glycyltransferase FemA/FemB family protein [Anaerolineales bacterium]